MQKNLRRFSILFLLLFLFISSAAWAGLERLWNDNAVSLRQGYHIEWQRAGALDEDGNVCYIWSDCRNGERDVYAQLISPSGQQLWGEEGKVIVSASVRQEDPDIISDGEGGFLISWVDYRLDSLGDVRAQRLDGNGNQLWDPQGVELCTIDTAWSLTLHTMPDGEGGAMVVWHDNRFGDDGDLFVSHVLSNGTVDPAYPLNGLMLAGGSGNQGGPGEQTVDTDGNGGVWVAWKDTRISGDPNIYVQHIATDGTLMWPANEGLPICTAENWQIGPKLCPDGSGGIFVVWEDKRNIATSNQDLYIQRVNSSGNIVFAADGIPFVTQPNIQQFPRIVNDGANSAIVVFEDFRNNSLVSDIYTQKIDDSGNILWDIDDVEICLAQGAQLGTRLNSDGNGGAVMAWRDERYGEYPQGDIFAQRVLSNGTVAWAVNGVPACTYNYLQEAPLVRAREDGSSSIAWGDWRFGSPGIYVQVFDAIGNIQLAVDGEQVVWGIDGNAQHARMIKLDNSANKYMVVWQDGRLSNAGNLIYQQVFDTESNIDFDFAGKPTSIKYEDFDSIMAGGQETPEITTDGEGGAIICYRDLRFVNQTEQIYAQRMNANGDILWDSLGVRIYSTDKNQGNNFICSDGNGGAYVAWSGYNPSWHFNAYVAHLDGDGNVLGVIELTETMFDEKIWGIVPDNQGGAYAYWQGGDWVDFNVYVARLTAPCDTLWTAAICDEPQYQNTPKAYPQDNGDVIFVWEDQRNTTDYDIYAQKMNLNGEYLWAQGGVQVVDAPAGDQLLGDLTVDSNGDVYVVWQDLRNGLDNDIYMQKIDGATGNIQFQASGIPVVVIEEYDQSLPKIITDLNDYPQLSWEDLRESYSDIFGSFFTPSGEVAPGWEEYGENVCSFSNIQSTPQMIDDYNLGVINVWEDYRSSGKEQIVNLYMQRWVDSNVSSKLNDVVELRDFQLSQNYPNPFNPETSIRFYLPEAGKIKLTIYNTLGQEVAVLVDGIKNAGAHLVKWDGKNSSGDFIATGIYYYKLEFNDNTKVMKMLLLK